MQRMKLLSTLALILTSACLNPLALGAGADIVGLELGMTQAELLAAIRSHNAALNLMEHTSEIVIRDSYKKPFKVAAYVAEVQAFWDPRAKGYKPSDPRQKISAVFTGPPNEHRVESIQREVRYVDTSTYPGFDSLVESLIGKYGPADFSDRRSSTTQMLWLLDGQSLTDQQLGRLTGAALNTSNNHSTRYHLYPVIDETLPPNVLSISDGGTTIRHGNAQYVEGGRFLAVRIVQQGAGVNFMLAVLQDSMMKIGKARGATAKMARAALARHEQQEQDAVQQRPGPDI